MAAESRVTGKSGCLQLLPLSWPKTSLTKRSSFEVSSVLRPFLLLHFFRLSDSVSATFLIWLWARYLRLEQPEVVRAFGLAFESKLANAVDFFCVIADSLENSTINLKPYCSHFRWRQGRFLPFLAMGSRPASLGRWERGCSSGLGGERMLKSGCLDLVFEIRANKVLTIIFS
jgi:hypothetical protein